MYLIGYQQAVVNIGLRSPILRGVVHKATTRCTATKAEEDEEKE